MRNLVSPHLTHLKVEENVIPYLSFTGWKQVPARNQWYVFQGGRDANDEPLEIVLPRNPEARDLRFYLENAVGLLAALKDEPEEEIIRRIVFFDRDVLSVRNLETGEYNSITLKLAARQVYDLRNLVNFSACSEYEPKPYFLQGQLSIARQMIEHYRFGHTFEGSFGFTIESQIVRMPSEHYQLNLFSESPPALTMPVERRVMERIIRGLEVTHQATRRQEPQLLIREYASGFNSNMCSAIVKMSQGKKSPLEYSILWSVKLNPAEDIERIAPIRLSETSYDYLEYAAEELKKLEPEFVTVIGKVVGLSSRENPLESSTNIKRSVVVRGRYRSDMKPIDVIIELGRDDYIVANDAHLSWKTVEVSGILSRSGNAWRLTEVSNLRIL
jgi:hypothetical protein